MHLIHWHSSLIQSKVTWLLQKLRPLKMDQQHIHFHVVTHLLCRRYSCDSPVGKSLCVLFTLLRHQWKSIKWKQNACFHTLSSNTRFFLLRHEFINSPDCGVADRALGTNELTHTLEGSALCLIRLFWDQDVGRRTFQYIRIRKKSLQNAGEITSTGDPSKLSDVIGSCKKHYW